MVRDFRDLRVWQASRELAGEVYRLTQEWPREERFGLTQQIQRAVVSVPSNIAEGFGRDTVKEYLRFLAIARGSLAEVQTQVIIAGDLGYVEIAQAEQVVEAATSVMKQVNALRRSLRHRVGMREEVDEFGADEEGVRDGDD